MGLDTGATVRKTNVRYRFLARQLYPENHNSDITRITSEEVVDIFKLVATSQGTILG